MYHNILVCGGRDFDESYYIYDVLDYYIDVDYTGPNEPSIINGGALGADKISSDYAENKGLMCKVYPADWEKHGKKAGPMRNQQMLDEEDIAIVFAFPTKNSKGTWDMIRRAKEKGVEVVIHESK